MEPQISVNKEAAAAEQTAGQISAASPRRALRGREDGGTNGAAAAAADSVTGSGRVLRDRSARGIPVWRQTDVDEEPEELKRLPRRKAPCPRRKKPERPLLESEDDKDARGHQGARVKRTGVQSGARPSRGSSKTACKVEPDADTDYVESSKAAVKTGSSADQKEECEDEEELLDEEEESPYVDDPKDRNYRPHSRSEEEESVSTDEDVTVRDQHNHRCCDDKESKRRHSSRLKEKEGGGEEKEGGGEEERSTPDGDPEIKTEGGHSATAQGDEPPRKRGRRRKDDKTPRMPKRRKKPPVQYVRCEMEGCGTVLAHPRYLQHHIKYQHLMKKKYVCPHPSCGRLFRLQKQLLRHAKHHTDQRDYICEFCARAFKSSHNLAVHRMIHTGEKPLQCEICGFTCRQKASLNWHMKKHDADASYQFSCGICGKKFEKKDSVVAHKAKSHPEVLIAEALAANAGALLTTPPGVTTLLEEGGVSSSLAPPPHLTFPQQLPVDHGPALLPEAPPHCQSGLGFAAQPPPLPRPSESGPVMWEGGGGAGNANGGGAWEAGGAGPDVTNSEAEIQCILLQ